MAEEPEKPKNPKDDPDVTDPDPTRRIDPARIPAPKR